MIGARRKKQHTSILLQCAVYIYLLNAVCKYFLPGTVTKFLPIMAVILAAMSNKEPFKLPLSRIDKPFIAFLIAWLIGCIYSSTILKGLGYVMSFSIAFAFSMYIRKKSIDEKGMIKFLSIMCTILAFGVILQPILPDVISNVNRLFSYSAEEYTVMNAWTRNGWYSGLFPDRAPAAFYCVVLVGTGLYYLYSNIKIDGTLFQRCYGVFFSFVGIYGILLTAKRGLLLGSLIAAFLTFIVYKKANQTSIWRICIAGVAVIIIVWFVFSDMEATQIMLLRFFDNDNLMTGRTKIYNNIFTAIWSSPIWGNGTASAYDILGIGGHNIYLTVFMENGIIGFILFVIAILYCLFCTINDALKFGKNGLDSKIPILMFSVYIQVFFLMYGMSGNPLYDNYILYFYVLALLITKNVEWQYKEILYNKEIVL